MSKTRKVFIPPTRDNYVPVKKLQEVEKTQTDNESHTRKRVQHVQQTMVMQTGVRSAGRPNSVFTTLTSSSTPGARQSNYQQDDKFFLHDNSFAENTVCDDVYEFRSSPSQSSVSNSSRETQHHRKGKQPSKGVRKRKDAVKKDVLKNIRKMQRALILLREREKSSLVTSEQTDRCHS